MELVIKINTENAAFEYDRVAEVARILTVILAKAGDTSDLYALEMNLRDINGNTVGSVTVK